jgi:transposase
VLFIKPIRMPHSKPFWKRMSWRSIISGGVFELLRYDNLSSAVKKILRGQRREENERFIGFRSHWGFQSDFCNPARGNEKGGVEGEQGYFRRNYLVPLPAARDLAHLNELLQEGSREEEQRVIAGRPRRSGQP